MDQCTEDYNCLVINNNAESNKLEDLYFGTKPKYPEFKIGRPKFWKHHNENCNNSYDSEDEVGDFTHKKKGPKKSM